MTQAQIQDLIFSSEKYSKMAIDAAIKLFGVKDTAFLITYLNDGDVAAVADEVISTALTKEKPLYCYSSVIEFKGEKGTVMEMAKDYGIKPNTLLKRLLRGMPVENALTTPIGKNGNRG